MKKKFIELSEEELIELSAISLRSSIQLIKDAIYLYKRKSYSTAFFLSFISLEELSKVFIFDDLVYKKITEANMDEEVEGYIKHNFFDHKSKHKIFIKQSEIDVPIKWIQKFYSGYTQTLKEKSLYVDMNNDPLETTQEDAKEIITIVHHSIVYLIKGIRSGIYSLYLDDLVSDIISPKDFYNFKRSWNNVLKGQKMSYYTFIDKIVMEKVRKLKKSKIPAVTESI